MKIYDQFMQKPLNTKRLKKKPKEHEINKHYILIEI